MMDSGKCKSCGSCGMPLTKAEECAGGNPAAELCCYCVDQTGALLPYDTVLKNQANWLAETQGLAAAAAMSMAVDTLAAMPVWRATARQN